MDQNKYRNNKVYQCDKCGYALAGEVTKDRIELRAINKQKTKIAYFQIFTTCHNCGQKNNLTGNLYKLVETLGKMLEKKIETDTRVLKVLDEALDEKKDLYSGKELGQRILLAIYPLDDKNSSS